ncbi:MAG: acyl-homoserine-lactone synthase [Planktomarina sp.]
MEVTTLSFADMHNHGALYPNFLRARKESFIERRQWDLPETDGMEFDQYDTPASRWIAVHQNGEVLAGIRLTPTTHRCGIYSYMIRDAQLGVIDTIPQNLIYEEAPVEPNVWEGSRMFVNNATPMNIRRRVHGVLTVEMIKTSRELGATRVLGLIPATWPRWASRLGCVFEAAGPVMDMGGVEYQCISMDMKKNMH